MYFYLYDSFLNDKRYERILGAIEARIADLDIKGRTVKLTVLQQLEETLRDAISRGAKTVVVVGNDSTVNQAVNIIANYKNVTLGIIPVGEKNEVARILGVPEEESACDVISNRLIDILDVGRINGQYFLSKIEIKGEGAILECDGTYKIKLRRKIERIIIGNLGYYSGRMNNPKDGALEISIIPVTDNAGLFSFFKKEKVESDSVLINKYIKVTSNLVDRKDGGVREKLINIDDVRIIKTPARVDAVPRQLKVIVGKERMF